MPTQNLAEDEISDLIAFLDWVSKVDNQGWPPRPILVTGSMVIPTSAGETTAATDPAIRDPSGTNEMAQGERLFRTVVPACNACHSTIPDADMAGPSLAGVATRAAAIIGTTEYGGEETDPEGYIRESIARPSAYLVPGAMYSAGGTSFMPATYGETLSEAEIAQLAAYLASFK
jgi:nitric oxide reductase subunit C